MIVARRDIGDQRTEGIERSFVAKLVFLLHLHLDLIERNVSWALDHHLHVVLPRLFRQLAQRLELGELRFVAGVGDAAGTNTSAACAICASKRWRLS